MAQPQDVLCRQLSFSIKCWTMGKTTDIQNNRQEWTLDALSQSIRQVHELFAAKAKHAVNLSLTLRIVEYQLHGNGKL